MITINKAILHILDAHSNITVFSEEELDFRSEQVFLFLTKHIEKIFSDSNAKEGAFLPTSAFKSELLRVESDFVAFSKEIAQKIASAIEISDRARSVDIVVCDFSIDGTHFLSVLQCDNRMGYTHQVLHKDGKIKNEIINHYSILPSATQKIDAYAIVDLSSNNVKFLDKKSFIEGQEVYILPERVLECSFGLSQKEAIKLV